MRQCRIPPRLPSRVSSFNHRGEKIRVAIMAFDGFESGLIGSHKNSRIPGMCLERVSYQIVDIAHDNRILFWSP